MLDHSVLRLCALRLRAFGNRIAFFLLPLLLAAPALAVTDKRSVRGATADAGPAIPEPSSIFLFAIGVAVVGFGVHKIRQRS